MFRFYELYSLYTKKMSSYEISPTWCLCEKLPRSLLHIKPPAKIWCEVCGKRRRPRAYSSSSSDEDENATTLRQNQLLEERRREEAMEAELQRQLNEAKDDEEEEEVPLQSFLHVKQVPKSRTRRNCFKCGGEPKPKSSSIGILGCSQQTKPKNRLYMARHGYCRKPHRAVIHARRIDEPSKQLQKTPPASPSPSPSPSPPQVTKPYESLWEPTFDDMPNLVAFAHEVFNRPLHLRQSCFYDDLFVSDLIPLDKPITDPAGGAISKQRSIFGTGLRKHFSRPLPPLSQVVSDILNKDKQRAKGGGLPAQGAGGDSDSTATQFTPFDSYDGPSEDALVVEDARIVLTQQKSLHIRERRDLPSTQLPSFESEPNGDCCTSSPYDVPTAPPVERHHEHLYDMNTPLDLHDVMKTVALSESTASSSSAGSNSNSSSTRKSVSSTLPVLQQSVRSRGGEQPTYEKEEAPDDDDDDLIPASLMEKVFWLMEHKPQVESENAETDPDQDEPKNTVRGLLDLMERLNIAVGADYEESADAEDEVNSVDNQEAETRVETSVSELQHSNDMSNVQLPLSSTNKTDDAKYMTVSSNSTSSTSMWSVITGFFSSTVAPESNEEMQPLTSQPNLHYGSTDSHKIESGSPVELKEEQCHGKKSLKQPKNPNSNCQKCGLSRPKIKLISSDKSISYSGSSTTYHTAKSAATSFEKSSTILEGNTADKTRHKSRGTTEQVPTEKSSILDKDKRTVIPEELKNSAKKETYKNPKQKRHTEISKVTENRPDNIEKADPILRELLHEFRRYKQIASKKKRVFLTAKVLQTVQHVCCESREFRAMSLAREMGVMKEYILSPVNKKKPMDLLEFRMPDIQNSLTQEISIESDNSTEEAHSESSQKSEATSANSLELGYKERSPKRKNSTAWPSYPSKQRKRQIKYKATQVELTYNLSDENYSTPEYPAKQRKYKKKRDESWIVNDLVQQKINEMMAKPIKLLGFEGDTVLPIESNI